MPGEFNDLIPLPNRAPRPEPDPAISDADGLIGFIGESEAPKAATPTRSGPREVGVLDASTTGLAQGLTFNTSDEIFSALATPFLVTARAVTGEDEGKSFSDRVSGAFNRELANQRALIEEAKRQQPLAFALGEISGTIAGPGKLFKAAGFAARATSRLGKLRGAVGDAGVIGALAGVGGADGENIVVEGVKGGFGGAALTPVSALAGKGVGLAFDKLAGRFRNVPQLNELRQTALRVFDDAEIAGFKVSNRFFRQFAQQADTFARRQKGFPRKTPGTAAILRQMDQLFDTNPTFSELQALREGMRATARQAGPRSRDGKLAEKLIARLDASVDSLSLKSVEGGRTPVAQLVVPVVKDFWRRVNNAQVIDDLFDDARRNAGQKLTTPQFTRALRKEFTKLSRDRLRMRTFNADERAAIQRVVNEGGPEQVANLVGKLGDRKRSRSDLLKGVVGGATGGVLGDMFGGGFGGAAGGAIGAAAPFGARLAGRAAANRIVRRSADEARRIVRRGGPRPPRTPAANEMSTLVRLGLSSQGPEAVRKFDRLFPDS